MKLSTRGRYGARAMLDLAIHYGEGTILLKDIAARQGISQRYLEHIMTTLVSNGLIQSSRGQQGGFSLAKSPREIKLSQIIQVLEGSLAPAACVENPRLCERATACVTRDIWGRLKKAIWEVLDSITLQDMVKMQREKLAKSEAQMYYI